VFLPLIAHIETHVDGDLSLDVLADIAGISTFHLQRTFAATGGETPRAFVERARLERAAL
jgi:AraC family transcriptional regulator